jgi:hypothetical protein
MKLSHKLAHGMLNLLSAESTSGSVPATPSSCWTTTLAFFFSR